MNLTAEQFAELVEGLDRDAASVATGSDRRRATRVERRSAMVITLVDQARPGKAAQSLSVTLRDFTPQGVGILLDRALEKGGQFVAKITRPGATAPAAVLYTIAYCTQLNAHLFKVGAEAQRIIP
jgi:hypothetical protein